MTVNKRKKNSRQRGSWTHGWGEKKKHRGAGNRGGRGMAGSGKKGDAKKPSIWHIKDYFGKRGFAFKGLKEESTPINIKKIEENYDQFLAEKKISEKNGVVTIDLAQLGYNKLLGTGKPTRKYQITVAYASSNAITTITKAGGTVNVQKASEKEKK